MEWQRWTDHAYRTFKGLPQVKRSMITQNLFLGGQFSVRSLRLMRKLGITAIVNMRISSIKNSRIYNEFKILHIPTPDYHAPSLEDLYQGTVFIKEEILNGGKVYVHCRLGEGRGPSMVIAYLIKEGLSYDDAFKMVKKVRTFIHPNKEQIARLKEFESKYGFSS